MKKNILIVILLVLGVYSYAQVSNKNIQNVPMMNPIEIIDITTPSAMGGDEVLWSEDFSDSLNIVSEDIADLLLKHLLLVVNLDH